MSSLFMTPIKAAKDFLANRRARKQAARDEASLETTSKENIELDEKLPNSQKATLNEATTAATGLGLKASNDVSPAAPILCKPHSSTIQISPSTTPRQAPKPKVDVDTRFIDTNIGVRTGRQAPARKAKFDPRFIDNPIGVGSYKSFETPMGSETSSSSTPNLSPTSTRFSGSSRTTLNEEDGDDIFPPTYQTPSSFDRYDSKGIDWAKGKRKGKAKVDEKPEVEAVKDYLTHVNTDNEMLEWLNLGIGDFDDTQQNLQMKAEIAVLD
ncbi:hypothetical protein P7C71_g1980, partial [Lecanoromycetidae sp. Uapishka_2]